MIFLKKAFLFIREFMRKFSEDRISVFAASAAFFMLISAIPFFMLLLGFAKYFIPFSTLEIIDAMSHFLPAQTLNLATQIINEIFSRTPASLISITAITLLWSASRGVLAIIDGLNAVSGADRYTFFKGRLLALIYTFLFVLILFLTLIVLLLGKVLFHGAALAYTLLLFAVMTIAFSAFYSFLPRVRTRFLTQIPGAILSSLSWFGFTYAYSLYIENFSDFSYVYGSLAAVVLLMLWLYICTAIFLSGAELNQMINEKLTTKRC